MEVHVVDSTRQTPARVREFVRQRITRQLARIRSRLRRVTARLGDANGPGGGGEKDVALEVVCRDGERVRLSARADTYGSALAQALRIARRLTSEGGARLRRVRRGSRA